ncbi:MAG: ABC transporter ATP-binding protein [Chloroflexi bacterium]|nr:ABC transporter ATP-binding protein [Chloroflexota bacterium]
MIPSSHRGPLLIARDLVRVFHTGGVEVYAVQGVNLEVPLGEFLVLLGRSGSGKTTLLNLLGGLDTPTRGSVIFEGRDITKLSDAELTELRRRRFGFVFQSFGLLPLLSAYENVELSLRLNGIPSRERRRMAEEALEQVGLRARAKHRPFELSGGEQQRVAIARALAVRPSLLLADEPTGDLDSATGSSIARLLKEIARERGITVVIATHDLHLAGMADRVKELVDGRFVEEANAAEAQPSPYAPPSRR